MSRWLEPKDTDVDEWGIPALSIWSWASLLIGGLLRLSGFSAFVLSLGQHSMRCPAGECTVAIQEETHWVRWGYLYGAKVCMGHARARLQATRA